MKKREIELAAKLLEMASDHYANHGCNDLFLPDSWSQAECHEFTLALDTWNGDPESNNPGSRLVMDWHAMAYLAEQLKTLSQSR